MNNPDYIGAATYSPEDNKLRLYPFARLEKELYDRVKAAGFGWAPKQELFVAPMWTPDRADLLTELCGEIEDEDKSLAERAEERAERFEDYSEKRATDAEQARQGVASIADNIPLGQPILVGHHSEKRARKDAERIENGMRRAVKMWETSEYWTRRAAGAVRAAKYKERPDVRARRIKGIEADRRKMERAKIEAERLTALWQGKLFLKNAATGEKRPLEITEENRAELCRVLGNMPACGVQVRGIDGQNWYSAWEILRPDEERYKNCPVKTVAELQEIALRLQARALARYDRWISHYDNRLGYERAMMAEDGGTEADQNKPEKGGACRCWASHRGGWSYIVKLNRVSVSVLDNWGNDSDQTGKNNFTRVIPFDKLLAIMSAADVAKHRASGAAMEYPDKTGFFLKGGTERPAGTDETDTAPAAAEIEKPAAPVITPEPEKPRATAADFEAMKETLKAGIKVVAVPQLFPTPKGLAQRVADLADIQPGHEVLEPSAGTGMILGAMGGRMFGHNPERGRVVAVEINRQLAEGLRREFPLTDVRCTDFLTCNGDLGRFDRILMNPPFQNGADIIHIRKALNFLKPGGRLVAICAGGPRQEAALQPIADSWERLPADTFKEQGTGVNTVLATFTKE